MTDAKLLAFTGFEAEEVVQTNPAYIPTLEDVQPEGEDFTLVDTELAGEPTNWSRCDLAQKLRKGRVHPMAMILGSIVGDPNLFHSCCCSTGQPGRPVEAEEKPSSRIRSKTALSELSHARRARGDTEEAFQYDGTHAEPGNVTREVTEDEEAPPVRDESDIYSRASREMLQASDGDAKKPFFGFTRVRNE